MSAGQSRHAHGTVRMAFDADGTILAADIDFVQDVGAYPTPWPGGDRRRGRHAVPRPVPRAEGRLHDEDGLHEHRGRTAYRGPWQFETLAREMLLDIAARRMGIDPVELRRRNLLRRDELPYTNPNGMPYDNISPLETFEQALAMLDYDGFRASRPTRARRPLPRRRDLGTTSSRRRPATGYGTEGATIRIEPPGTVNVYIAGGSTREQPRDHGRAAHRRRARRRHRRRQHDPGRHRGHAVRRGHAGQPQRLDDRRRGRRDRRRSCASGSSRIAAHQLEAAIATSSSAQPPGHRARHPAIGVTLRRARRPSRTSSRRTLPPGMPAGLEASARYTVAGTDPSGPTPRTCARARSTSQTGQVTLLRYIVSEDCGPMINPNVVEGQIAGGIVQGIGGALLEHLAYDDDGNPLATTFIDYLLPTATEVPDHRVRPRRDPGPGPGGYKGVGEGGAIGAPPAVVNAVADALAPLGVTITRLPASPSSIASLLSRGETGETRLVRLPPPRHHRRSRGLLAELGDWVTVPRSWRAARAWSRCCRCGWPTSTISSTFPGSTSCRASTAGARNCGSAREPPRRK